MKYLIDTDISSYFLRGKYNLDRVFEQKGFQNLRISIVTVAELKVLVYRSAHSLINEYTINEFAQRVGILEVDQNTWEMYSMLKSETLNLGKKRGDLDILNASIARQHKLVMVTNNTRHYEDLVPVQNWIDPAESS